MLEGLGLDRYERKARLQPALWLVLPPAALVAVWVPQVRTFLGGGFAAALVVAVLTVLLSWVRQRGWAVQARMVRDLGAMPSIILLRHRDRRVPPQTKARIHARLAAAGFVLPLPDEEAEDPAAADVAYKSGATWLLEATRSDRLLKEANAEYGFRRNLLGVRGPVVSILAACLVMDAVAIFGRESIGRAQLAAALLLAAAYLAALVGWATVVRPSFVEAASWNFAERMMSAAAAGGG